VPRAEFFVSQTETESYAVQQKVKREFKAYLKGIAARLPELSARTFALRDKMYSGCGFHWSLERSLGKLIVAANDYENGDYWKEGRDGMAARIMVEVGFETFIESLEEFEKSAAMMAEQRAAAAEQRATEFQSE
jgi:hypothetical protein